MIITFLLDDDGVQNESLQTDGTGPASVLSALLCLTGVLTVWAVPHTQYRLHHRFTNERRVS